MTQKRWKITGTNQTAALLSASSPSARGPRLLVWPLYLMGSADEVQVVTVEELADDVGSEREGDAAVVLSPALHVFVRVRPQQVAQEACGGQGG